MSQAPAVVRSQPKGPWHWSVEQFRRAVESGVFPAGARLELLAGTIYEKPMENAPHAYAVDTLYDYLARQLDLSGCFLRNQHALPLAGDSAPIPDIAVVAGQRSDFAQSHPSPDRVLLVIEVSDATLSEDRNAKAALYAAAGIPEYWILSLNRRRLEVHRDPAGDEWGTVLRLSERQSVSPLFAPGVVLAIADLLPPHLPEEPPSRPKNEANSHPEGTRGQGDR